MRLGYQRVVKPVGHWFVEVGGAELVGKACDRTPDEISEKRCEHSRLGNHALLPAVLSGAAWYLRFLYTSGEIYARFAQWS